MSQEATSEKMSTQTQFTDEQTVQQAVQQQDTSSSETNTHAPVVVDVVNDLDHKSEQTTNTLEQDSGSVSHDQVTESSNVVPQENSQEAQKSQEDIESSVISTGDAGLATSIEPHTEQSEQSNESFNNKAVSFNDISLGVVSFNRTYCRNRGTLSQLVKSFEDMSQRLSEPLNDYQKGLYPQIQSECKKIVESYSQLLSTIDPADNYVVGFYVNGPSNDGKRKATTTAHEQKSYGVSEYKETLKSTNDRLRHIKIDCQRKLKESTRSNQSVFQRMIDFCDAYHQTVNTHIGAWDTFISQFRQDNNINKQERPPKQPRVDMIKRSARADRTRTENPQRTVTVDDAAPERQLRAPRPNHVKRSQYVKSSRDTTQNTVDNAPVNNASVDGLAALRSIATAIKTVVEEVEKQQITEQSEQTDIVLSTVSATSRSRGRRSDNKRSEQSKQSVSVDQPTNQTTRLSRQRFSQGSQNTAQSQIQPEIRSDAQVRVSKRVLLRSVDNTSNTKADDREQTFIPVKRVLGHVPKTTAPRVPRPRKVFRDGQAQNTDVSNSQPRVDATAFNSTRIVRPKKNVSAKRIVNERIGGNKIQAPADVSGVVAEDFSSV